MKQNMLKVKQKHYNKYEFCSNFTYCPILRDPGLNEKLFHHADKTLNSPEF